MTATETATSRPAPSVAEWVAEIPPAARRGRSSQWESVAEDLRAHPGQAARIEAPGRNAGNAAQALRKRYPDCDWRVINGALYGQYIGPEAA